MVAAHEANILYVRNFLEEITKNKYNQEGVRLKDLKPDTFERASRPFRQWSDEFSGQRKLDVCTLDGQQRRSMTFQVASVKKALGSVSQMEKNGNKLVFDQDSS